MSEIRRVSRHELDAECGRALPTKEVISLLDLNVDVNVALDLAAPIDLAIAGNLNVAAPVDGSVTANVLSFDSAAQAMAKQQVALDQYLSGSAVADAPQNAGIDQTGVTGGTTDTGGTTTDTGGTTTDTGGTTTDTGGTTTGTTDTGGTLDTSNLFSSGLLNINANVDLKAGLAAPIAGAVAVNGNVVAPIDASVSANVLSFDSSSVAVADQTAIVHQSLDGVTATANADQTAQINQ